MTLLGFIALYLIASIGIGVYAATRVRNTADYALAGRSLPLFVIVATTFATWFGSETVLGIPSKFVEGGFRNTVEDPFGAGLCLVLVGMFFARKLYNMDLLTIGDFYRRRYGRGVEIFSSIVILISYLGGSRRKSPRLGWCSICCRPVASAWLGAWCSVRRSCSCTHCSAACGRSR